MIRWSPLPSEDLQQLRDSIVPFFFIDELEKDIVDRTTDERTQVEEFAIDTMQSCLQKVALTRVFAVK